VQSRHDGVSVDARQALDHEVAGQQVRDALGVVRDPQLRRAVTELGFVGGVSIDGTRVHVYLRLPAYFGARDLAWLVVADARAAVAALPWVDSVEVCLRGDHGVHHTRRPGDVLGAPSEGTAGLDSDQRQVCRLAFHARHLELIRGLLEHGVRRAELGGLRIRDLPASPETAVYLQRRRELGLRVDPAAALVVTESGDEVTDIDGYLGQLRALASGEGGRSSSRGPLQAGRHRSAERF
jgi:metal-sulfur cluster biosynthetic enzyme